LLTSHIQRISYFFYGLRSSGFFSYTGQLRSLRIFLRICTLFWSKTVFYSDILLQLLFYCVKFYLRPNHVVLPSPIRLMRTWNYNPRFSYSCVLRMLAIKESITYILRDLRKYVVVVCLRQIKQHTVMTAHNLWTLGNHILEGSRGHLFVMI
jgi:hypothetical protein